MRINNYDDYQKTRNNITMNNLRTIRNNKGYNVVKLAHMSNLTDSTISAYESGAKLPSITSLINLAEALDTSLDYLVDRTNNPISISKYNNQSFKQDTNEIISNYESLNKQNKEKLKAYLKGLMDAQNS